MQAFPYLCFSVKMWMLIYVACGNGHLGHMMMPEKQGGK